MNKLYKTIFWLCMQMNMLYAQPSTYNLQFVNPQINCLTQQFCIDIQIRNASGGQMAIGSYTVFFQYNPQSINFPAYTGTHFNDLETCVGGFSPYLANSFGADTLTGDANITTLMQYPNLGCPLIDENWVQMGYVCFDIINPEQSTQLHFDPGLTLFNLNDNYPAHIQGSLNSYDILPDCNLIDTDGDTLTDGQEIALSTDPTNPDTDGDTLTDGQEIALSTNPTNPDTDGDTLTDGQEIALSTDPTNPDTDGDTLTDGQEIALSTNPTNPDTDGDTLTDGQETPDANNPINTDGDGLINALDDDDDNDGILSILEDNNQNGNLLDDDIDQDGIPDYLDAYFSISVAAVTAPLNAYAYPNPLVTADVLHVVWPESEAVRQITLYDVTGQIKYQYAATDKNTYPSGTIAPNRAQIPMANMPTAIYVLCLEYSNRTESIKVFVCK